MKATNIGKTIIVWDKLSDSDAKRVINALKIILINYRQLTQDCVVDRPTPIALKDDNNYLCIIKKTWRDNGLCNKKC